MTVTAKLYVERVANYYDCTLVLRGDVDELFSVIPVAPKEEAESAQYWLNVKNAESSYELGWIYNDKLFVVARSDGSIVIANCAGRGRGQMAMFDRLVGARVAEARRKLGRSLNGVIGGGAVKSAVTVTMDDIELMIDKIDAAAIDEDNAEFELWRVWGC